MLTLRRVRNVLRYGIGARARERKQRERQKEREQRFWSETWEHDSDVPKRRYGSYSDYVDHQAAKLDAIRDRLEETEAEDLVEFERRFASCEALTGGGNALCLGARLGTEVRALLGLGYFAIGLDLNPGSQNAYVLKGDFHRTPFPDDSVDVVYCNAIDHAFDLEALSREIARLLRPGGVFIADLEQGYEEGFVPGKFESIHWSRCKIVIDRIAEHSGLTVESTRDLGFHRRDRWTQAVFRMPA